MVVNHRIKPFLFKWYALISALVFAAAMVFAVFGELDWPKFAAVTFGAYAFAFAVQKQNLEETRLFKELFEQFNKRYDETNDDLNRICRDSESPLTESEIKTLYKYFNLCGEEYLYYQKGFICEEVWRTWNSGMEFFRQNPRINRLWEEDLKDNDSYYGLKL